MRKETTHQINFDMNEYKIHIENKIQNLDYISLIETESGEEHRAFRLNDILIVCRIYNEDTFHKIGSLLDHKGLLNVCWEENPSEEDKKTMSFLWEKFGNESPSCIDHYLLTAVKL